MSETSVETVEVLLHSSNEKENKGVVRVQRWGPAERKRRALKTLAICWGIAIVSVIFPIVHFVAVPGFLLAGPIAAFFVWAQEGKVLGGECVCPSCGKPFQVTKGRPQWPLSDVCSNCHEAIKITPRQELRQSATSPQP
jgi:hypothetical protein